MSKRFSHCLWNRNGNTAIVKYPSQTIAPVKTGTPAIEITSTPVDTHLDLGNIKPGQYLLAETYEQGQRFLDFISTDKQIKQRLSLESYIDVDTVFGGHFLNADFATSSDGTRFLIMRPLPKNSYLLNLETGQWKTLNIQEKCLNASWSPDKTVIALECFDTGPNEIHFYDTASNSFEIVTDCEKAKNICGEPEWSPDGRWLSYLRIEARSGPQTINGIYLFDTSCVQSDNCMETEIGPIKSDSNPNWSADNKLIFARSGMLVSYEPINQILENTNVHLPDSRSAFNVKLSPDEKFLTILASKTGGKTIYLYSKETKKFDVLLDDPNVNSIVGWVVVP